MSAPDANSTERFSDRVENYVRYRPGYPAEVLDILRLETGLTADSVVADVGSGTGISTEMFLRFGATVHAVEPNREMRLAAERLLGQYDRFHSVAATAEGTKLPDHSMTHVTAAQAFHWFDADRARAEFQRILKPDGWVILLWNERKLEATPFLQAYEALLKSHATDYAKVRHENIGAEQLQKFFRGGEYTKRTLPNAQSFDYEGLAGRLLSSSYAPAAGQPGHVPMMETLRDIFARHESDGRVSFEYDTSVYFGHA